MNFLRVKCADVGSHAAGEEAIGRVARSRGAIKVSLAREAPGTPLLTLCEKSAER